MTSHTVRKKLTTSALSGSPQLLARCTAAGCWRTVDSPSAMTPRRSVGVVAMLVIPSSASRRSTNSGVGVAWWQTTGTPMARATM